MPVSSVVEYSCNQNKTIIFIEYIYMTTSMLSAPFFYQEKDILPGQKRNIPQ